MAWFNLDISPIVARCQERGDIQHIRFRIRDFDPFDLRIKLPAAVQIIADQVAEDRRVYIHCTAGELASADFIWRPDWSQLVLHMQA